MPAPSSGPSPVRSAEVLIEQMRSAGMKLTPQRLAIARQLAGDISHPTAQQLHARLMTEMPTMSFATVYNTLARLSDLGLMQARAFAPGATRFDPDAAPHDHAVCEGCGAVIDVPACDEPLPRPLPGFRLRAVERVYRGRCAACDRSGTRSDADCSGRCAPTPEPTA